MHAATASAEIKIHLDDPVSSLLSVKGYGVWSITPEATVYEAIERMAEKKIGALVVLAEGQLVGIISERDYARKVILKGRQSRETHVFEVMTAPVVSITPEHTIDECMHLVTSERVRHLPVLDGDKVVAMLSIGDLVSWIIRSHEHTIHQLQSYIMGAYPG